MLKETLIGVGVIVVVVRELSKKLMAGSEACYAQKRNEEEQMNPIYVVRGKK